MSTDFRPPNGIKPGTDDEAKAFSIVAPGSSSKYIHPSAWPVLSSQQSADFSADSHG